MIGGRIGPVGHDRNENTSSTGLSDVLDCADPMADPTSSQL